MAQPISGVPWTSQEPDDLSENLGESNDYQEDLALDNPDALDEKADIVNGQLPWDQSTSIEAIVGDAGAIKPFNSFLTSATAINGFAVDTDAGVITAYAPSALNTANNAGLADVCLLTDGRLIAAFRSGASFNSGKGTLSVMYSLDSGKTWGSYTGTNGAFVVGSYQTVWNDATYDCRGMGVSQLADGRVAISFTFNNPSNEDISFPESAVYTLGSATSAGSHTWSTPVAFAPGFTGFSNVVDGMVDLGDGRVVQAMQGSNSTSNLAVAGVCGIQIGTYTAGGTITWGSFIETANVSGKIMQEPSFIVADDGSWRMFVRNQTDFALWETHSDDEGDTWSSPAALSTALYGCPRVLKMSDGTLALVSRSSVSQGQRQPPMLIWSNNDGASWSSPIPLEGRGGFFWYGYGGICEIKPGMLCCLYSLWSSLTGSSAYGELCVRFPSKVAGFTPAGTFIARGVVTLDGGFTAHNNGWPLTNGLASALDSAQQRQGVASFERGRLSTAPSPISTRFGRGFYFKPVNVASTTPVISFGAVPISGATTIELWYKLTQTVAVGTTELVAKWNSTSSIFNYRLGITSTGVSASIRNSSNASAGVNVSSGNDTNLHHIAYVWDGSATATLYLDGTSVGTAALTAILTNDTATPTTLLSQADGANRPSVELLIDEVRISNTARYTTTFTPSTVPFTVDANTLFLAHCDALVPSL